MPDKNPNCYECSYRREITWDCHSDCRNCDAKVKGNPHGIKNGWFRWPFNFDPTWLVECDGFKQKEK